jgi:cyanophycinase-like exopeptidase
MPVRSILRGGVLGIDERPECRRPPVGTRSAPSTIRCDVIYVGGGSTANLLALWRAHGLGVALRDAWSSGSVLSGVSAGMVCWSRRAAAPRSDRWEFRVFGVPPSDYVIVAMFTDLGSRDRVRVMVVVPVLSDRLPVMARALALVRTIRRAAPTLSGREADSG